MAKNNQAQAKVQDQERQGQIVYLTKTFANKEEYKTHVVTAANIMLQLKGMRARPEAIERAMKRFEHVMSEQSLNSIIRKIRIESGEDLKN
jgi:hypothetical protein